MNNFENTPNKIGIRKQIDKNGKVKHGYKHYDHMPKFYARIIRFIEYNIGKDFNKTYSKFCNKVASTLAGDNQTAIDAFLFEFRFSKYSNGKYITNVEDFWINRKYYYIDEDGKIAKHKSEYARNTKKKHIYNNRRHYVFNLEDVDKRDWKRVLAELQDSENKDKRDRKKEVNERNEHLLAWLEYQKKLRNEKKKSEKVLSQVFD